MSSYMYEFRQRLKHMQEQGFNIPRYIQNIKLEKTARKYTYEKIAKKSTFREMYQGKERIVKGERGLELLRSKSAQKGVETKKKKKGITPPIPPEPPIKPWEDEKRDLIANINAILDSFAHQGLANSLRWLFKKRVNADDKVFWEYLLSQEETVIARLQEDAKIPSSAVELAKITYSQWETFLNYGESLTIDRMKEIGEESDIYEEEEI